MSPFSWGWLYAYSPTVGNATRIFLTIDGIPRGSRVYATCALTLVSQAITIASNRSQQPGQVSVAIKRWSVFNRDGSIANVEPGAGWELNNEYIDDAASVTFQLLTSGAIGYASAAVFID